MGVKVMCPQCLEGGGGGWIQIFNLAEQEHTPVD